MLQNMCDHYGKKEEEKDWILDIKGVILYIFMEKVPIKYVSSKKIYCNNL